MNVKELSSFIYGKIIGDENLELIGASKIEEAKTGEFTFISNQNYFQFLETTNASAVIVSNKIDFKKYKKLPKALILVDDPYFSFVIALEKFQKIEPLLPNGIHKSAIISETAKIGNNSKIGANVFIGENVTIGQNATILQNVVIERNVTIGDDALIYSNVTVREKIIIGNRVILNPGCVIGSDGFGWAQKKNGSYRKIPQLGIVLLEDDVSIGANSCIDRATIGQTIIKRGTKIDNLVQIGHNVLINEDTVVAGSTGIAGSTKIGSQVKIGGAVGIAGHLKISDKSTIGGGSIVLQSIENENETVSGYPARPIRLTQKIEVILKQLPEIYKNISILEKKIIELENIFKKDEK